MTYDSEGKILELSSAVAFQVGETLLNYHALITQLGGTKIEEGNKNKITSPTNITHKHQAQTSCTNI